MTHALSLILFVLSCAMPLSQEVHAAVSVNTPKKQLELTGEDAVLMFRIFREARASRGEAPAPFKLSYLCEELQSPIMQKMVMCSMFPPAPPSASMVVGTFLSKSSTALLGAFMKIEIGQRFTQGIVNCTMPVVSQLECTISEISFWQNGWQSWPR